MKRAVCLLSALLAASLMALAGTGPGIFCPEEPFAHLAWSPDGRYLALGRQDGGTILLYDVRLGRTRDLGTGPASGNEFAWSPDGRWLGYKIAASRIQKAMVLEVENGKRQELASGALVGQVAWLDTATVVFTLGRQLVVKSGKDEVRWDIGAYVNQVSVEGRSRLAVFGQDNRLILADLKSGQSRTCFTAEADIFAPRFSPEGDRILFATVDQKTAILDLRDGDVRFLESALFPVWLDGERIVFVRKKHWAQSLIESQIYVYHCSSKREFPLEATGVEFPGRLAVGASQIAVSLLDASRMMIGRLKAEASGIDKQELLELGGLDRPQWPLAARADAADRAVVPGWMPYIHQVYDTPDDFNGSAACGPTSCMMAIGYYHRYAVWNDTVHVSANPPGTHVSPYGKYDCRIYTYGGYTFSDTCSPPTGPPAYGAYGYCCTHGAGAWAYKCRDYIRKHDLNSDYDLSVSWSDITAQIDQGYPVVLSTAITSAGHLMCVRGYVSGQHTIVVNDPAGNRNNGPYWNYPGDNAYYDWPGYNNGYVNINSASWLVTAAGRHTRLALADFPDTVDAGHYYTITFTDTTSRFQTNNTFVVDVCDASSGAVVFSGNQTGLNDSLGGIWNIMNLSAPRTSAAVYFKSYLTPAGGNYDTRYISYWTDGRPTVVRPINVRDNLINSGFESGLWPWADTENADLVWDDLSHSGSKSLRLVPRVLTDYVPAVAHQDVRVVPGQNYVFSGWARKNDGSGNNVRLAFMWYGADDVQIGSQVVSPWLTVDEDQFHYLATPVSTAPAGAAYACLRLYVKGYGRVGDNFDDLYFGDPSGVAEIGDGGRIMESNPEGRKTLSLMPNPFNKYTNIKFQIHKSGPVSLKVYNMAGQCVRTLVSEFRVAGSHLVIWDGRDERGLMAAPGVYICRLTAEGISLKRTMALLR